MQLRLGIFNILWVYRSQWPTLAVRYPTRHLFALDEPKIVFDEAQN